MNNKDVLTPRPSIINLAIILFIISIILGFIGGFTASWNTLKVTVSLNPLAFSFYMLLTVIFFIWIIWKIALGRNWARIFYLAYSILGLLTFFAGLITAKNPPIWIAEIITAISWIVQFIAMYIVFFSSGAEWFKSQTLNN